MAARNLRLTPGAGWMAVLLSVGCASGYPFVRPTATTQGTIRNEATGKSYDDCKAAFAEATADTVLTFSEGVFACGEEVSPSAGWLVVRGAGLGHTFLTFGDPVTDPPKPLRLTSIRATRYMRIEDLAFGGITDLPESETRVEIVRAAMATERNALFGGSATAQMEGSAVVIHSILVGWSGLHPPDSLLPKPVAIQGNNKIALIESVAYDVEQEFERFPAPGTIVLLSTGFQKAFSSHDPASKSRPDPSPRANVACGVNHNPAVYCASESQMPAGDGVLVPAAAALFNGASLTTVEPMIRKLSEGFDARFQKSLGVAIRQAEVYWFDDAAAQILEDEAKAKPSDAIAVIARPRTAAVVERCSRSDQTASSITEAIETARTVDKLLGAPTTETACRTALKTRVAALIDACKTSWDWAKVLEGISSVDTALGSGTQEADECRKNLVARLPPPESRGTLAETYLREVARELKLDVPQSKTNPVPSIVEATKLLPWIRTRSSRTLTLASTPTILDRIMHALQMDGAGDGRELVELTAPCSLAVAGASTRAGSTVTLGEMPPHAKTGQNPKVVLEVPVLATQEDVPANTAEGSIANVILTRCDEKAGTAYEAAVRRYFVEELGRQYGATTGKVHSDLDMVIRLIKQETGTGAVIKEEAMPTVPAALTALSETLKAQPLNATPVASHLEDAPTLLRPPPDWTMKDFETGADQLSRVPAATVENCELAMPDIPWRREKEGGTRGAVNLEGDPVIIHCQGKDKVFELSLKSQVAVSPKQIDNMMRALVVHLGWPKNSKWAAGETREWDSKNGGRTAMLFVHPKAGNEMLTVDVPLGSAWPK